MYDRWATHSDFCGLRMILLMGLQHVASELAVASRPFPKGARIVCFFLKL